jgi:MFS family permease
MSTTTEPDAASTTITPQIQRRATIAGAIGTVVEWYDFGLYGTASALFLGPLFFSGASPAFAILASFATFAVGFAIRPLGGIILGNLGDRYGRKPVLIVTVILMGSATFLVGCLPTSLQVGVLAPILLVLLRLLQGFGAGAELAGAFTFVRESSTKKRRGFTTGISAAAAGFGQFLGNIGFFILNSTLSTHDMLAWGWRIPFLASIIIVVVAILVRSKLQDSPELIKLREQAKAERAPRRLPLAEVFRNRPVAWIAGFLVPTMVGFVGYTTQTFGVSFAVNQVKISPQVTLTALLIMGAVSTVTCIIFGFLVDKIGPQRVLYLGAACSIIWAFPFFALIQTGQAGLVILAIVVSYAIGFSMASAAQGEFLPSLFETRYRFSGVATSREFSSAIVAGPAPFVGAALTIAAGGSPWLVSIAVIVACLLTVLGTVIGQRQRKLHGVD